MFSGSIWVWLEKSRTLNWNRKKSNHWEQEQEKTTKHVQTLNFPVRPPRTINVNFSILIPYNILYLISHTLNNLKGTTVVPNWHFDICDATSQFGVDGLAEIDQVLDQYEYYISYLEIRYIIINYWETYFSRRQFGTTVGNHCHKFMLFISSNHNVIWWLSIMTYPPGITHRELAELYSKLAEISQ